MLLGIVAGKNKPLEEAIAKYEGKTEVAKTDSEDKPKEQSIGTANTGVYVRLGCDSTWNAE